MANAKTKPHKKKLQTMALSILVAVIVWFMVMSLTNPSITTTVSNLNVRFVGERDLRDKQLAITGRADIPQLSAVVSGNRSDLMNYLDSIYVQVDVSNITEAGEYSLTGTISVPTTRISVEKENYGDIPITVEAVSSKDIEVTVRQTGILRGKLVESVIKNPIVKITGAESEINKLSGAFVTVDISKVHEDRPERMTYLLTDSSGSLVTGNETLEAARSEVEVTNAIYDIKTLPIEPMLNAELDRLYILDKDKTTFTPSTVSVGVKEYNTDEKVTLVIDRPSDGGETEYMLKASDGMYIPPESRTISAIPVLESRDPMVPEYE